MRMTQNPTRPTHTMAERGLVDTQTTSKFHPQEDPMNVRSIFRPHVPQEVVQPEAHITELDTPVSLNSRNGVDYITQAFSQIETCEVVQGYPTSSPPMSRIPSSRLSIFAEHAMSVDGAAVPPSIQSAELRDELGEEGRFSVILDTVVGQFPDDVDAASRERSLEGSHQNDVFSDMSIED